MLTKNEGGAFSQEGFEMQIDLIMGLLSCLVYCCHDFGVVWMMLNFIIMKKLHL